MSQRSAAFGHSWRRVGAICGTGPRKSTSQKRMRRKRIWPVETRGRFRLFQKRPFSKQGDLMKGDAKELKPLQVERRRKSSPRPRHNDAVNYAALWNALAPPGTLIRFFPTWGRWDESREDTIRHRATVNSAREPVLWLENTRGCVSAYHCEPLYSESSTEKTVF
jgi:hypothetical protein